MNKSTHTCGIVYFRHEDFRDESGCLKPAGHSDHHICRTDNGTLMAWEDDYDCNCGCWEDEDELIEVCKIYWEVSSIN